MKTYLSKYFKIFLDLWSTWQECSNIKSTLCVCKEVYYLNKYFCNNNKPKFCKEDFPDKSEENSKLPYYWN